MDNEYIDLYRLFKEKLESEIVKLDASPLSKEYAVKEAIVDYCKYNIEAQIIHIDFLSALFSKDNTLDYIYQNAKDIPVTRLIDKASNGTITLTEILELVGDDAYCEALDMERMQKIDGHAYFIRKPNSYDELQTHTLVHESRNTAKSSPYYIFKTVELDDIKYDDFLNNRLGYTHKFIADHAEGCYENKFGILQCIRVVNIDNPKESLLIQSEGYDYARYAAIEIKPKEIEKKKTNNRNLER